MHERADPLIVVLELVKCLLRFKEYKGLIHKEHTQTYIDIDAYKEMKRLKEIKENHFLLVRSKKRLPKIKNFKVSEKMLELRKN